jgi:hypothetical protein
MSKTHHLTGEGALGMLFESNHLHSSQTHMQLLPNICCHLPDILASSTNNYGVLLYAYAPENDAQM